MVFPTVAMANTRPLVPHMFGSTACARATPVARPSRVHANAKWNAVQVAPRRGTSGAFERRLDIVVGRTECGAATATFRVGHRRAAGGVVPPTANDA